MLTPEMHEGRLLWIPRNMLDKITNGDPVLGWEGDPDLGVFLEQEEPPVWAIYRWENGDWSHVIRTEPGIPFDERVIHWLLEHDMRRKPDNYDLDAVVRAHNDAVDKADVDARNEYIAEELAPRLAHALGRDGV